MKVNFYNIFALLFFLILFFYYLKRFSFRKIKTNIGTEHFLLTGSEFFIIGLCLGIFLSKLSFNLKLNNISIFIYITFSWIGLRYGLELNKKTLYLIKPVYYTFSFTLFILCFSFILLLLYISNTYFNYISSNFTNIKLIIISLSLTTASGAFLFAILNHYIFIDKSKYLIKFHNNFEGVFAIIILGFINFSFFSSSFIFLYSILMNIIIGFILGYLYFQISSICSSKNDYLILIMGIICLNAGICKNLGLHPLFFNMVTGICLANFINDITNFKKILDFVEKPLYFIFLILAGSIFIFFNIKFTVLLSILFICIKFISRVISVFICKNLFSYTKKFKNNFYFSFFSNGSLSIIILLSILLLYKLDEFPVFIKHHISDSVIACFISIIFYEFISPSLFIKAYKKKLKHK